MTTLHIADGFFRRAATMPVLHVLLWSTLAVLTVVLIILSRTRWAQNRPLQKCAILSLIVHLLLACLAMTVRIVAGSGGMAGSGVPIRVRIVNEEATPSLAITEPLSSPAEELAPPELLEPPAPSEPETPAETPTEVVETEPIESAPADEEPLPSELPSLAEEIAAVPELIAPPVSDESPPDESLQIRDDSTEVVHTVANPGGSEAVSGQTQANTTDVTPVVQSESAMPAAAPYALRTESGRLGLVEAQGGSAETEAAVAAALQWLAAAQSSDGRWDASQFGAGHELAVLGHNRGGAGRNADTGISALAILAFLGAGHTHTGGDYERTVERGLDFLLRSQAANGSLFGAAEHYAQMYCHSMATFALAETLAMTRDDRIESGVRQAVAFSLRAQNSSSGGWRYRIGDIGDTSQLGWQMMALASAHRGGVDIPPQTWTGIERFLRTVRRGHFGGLASYRPDGPASTPMTAEALYCRELLAEIGGGAMDERASSEATSQLISSLPNNRETNLYYWYYATLALHKRHTANDRARADWQSWNESLTSVLLTSQITDGQNVGSWDPNCLWGGYGGRVYSTALAAMCLEVYYRYAPAPASSEDWIANRPRE